MLTRTVALLAWCVTLVWPHTAGAQAEERGTQRADLTSNVVALSGRKAGREQPLGSGVVMPGGMVLTACHVLDNASGITVRQGTARSEANLLEQDPERNLCRLGLANIGRFRVASLEILSVEELAEGEPVFAVGFPLGGSVRIIEGNVVRIERVKGEQIVQISSRLVPGFSGGALFAGDGTFIGITTYQPRNSRKLSYAYPVSFALSERPQAVAVEVAPIDPPPVDYKTQLENYLRDIAQASVANITYPEEAREQQWTGTSSIALRIDPGGELKDSYVDVSSGYASLDVVALLAVRKAVSARPPPPLLRDRGFAGKIAIHFELAAPAAR